MADRRPLSAADSAWLRVDRENNHMIITAVLTLRQRIAFAQVQERLDERLRPYPRLRQRVAVSRFGLARPRWVDDPHFSIERQTEIAKLPDPAGQAGLESFVGELMRRSFDPNRPLWRIYYVENYVRADAGDPNGDWAALIVRVHHCVADGIALLRILLSLTDEPPEITFPTAAAGWARSDRGRFGVARLPRWGGVAVRSAAHFAHFLGSRPDPESRLRRPLGPDKFAAWSKPIPLAQIKSIGSALGGTVNEVLLCAAAGALGRVLEQDPEFDSELVLRGVVPVNLRADEDLAELGNRFGLVFMPMHVGIHDPRARLERVREAMRRIKASPEALAWFAILRALGRVPSWIEALGVELFSRKASLVITSLDGPRDALHFCGAEIGEIMFWVPCAGEVGLGMSMLTYDDRVQLCVVTDANQFAEPSRIVGAFEAEVAELVEATNSRNAAP